MLENKNLEKVCIKGVTCCHGNEVSDALMDAKFLTFFNVSLQILTKYFKQVVIHISLKHEDFCTNDKNYWKTVSKLTDILVIP